MENIILVVALIGILGIGAQWMAWRFNLPAIVLMALAGLAFGQAGLGVLDPQEDFGEFYRPLIAIAVAVILFEGGLSLNFDEIRDTVGKGVFRLVLPGVPIAWALGAMAAHYAAGLSWSAAVLFSGIMIVTGPTVIMPLLRQARLSQRPGALLKWEGIVNDPIGALLAVIVYEFMTHQQHGLESWQVVGSLFLGTLLALAWGFTLGQGMAVLFRRGWVPEYLKSPVLLTAVLACFETANIFQEEAGLLAVTAMGVTIANARLPAINDLRHFKETITVLFVSGVFVILTAALDRETLFLAFSPQIVLFVGIMMFLVRPISIMISTIGAGLKLNERLLIAWIAPRGIVAVAVSSFFAGNLVDQGDFEAGRMIPLAFAMVFFTVVFHGFSMRPLGRVLGLAASGQPGVLIVGSTVWSVAFAKKLMELKIPVTIADESWRQLRPAREAGVPTYYGEILSEVTEHHLDLNRFGYLIAAGYNEAHNSLVATDLAPEMNRASIYQLSARGTEGRKEHDRRAIPVTLRGRRFMASRPGLDELIRQHYEGWFLQVTKVTEAYPPEKYLEDLAGGEPVLLVRKETVWIAAGDVPLKPETGDTVMAWVPPELRQNKQAKRTAKDEPPKDQEIEDLKEEALAKMPDSAQGG